MTRRGRLGRPIAAASGALLVVAWLVAGLTASRSDLPSQLVVARGKGYWLAESRGRVAAFGDAAFFGGGAPGDDDRVIDIAPTPTGNGYWLVTVDGDVQAFGDAPHLGELVDTKFKGMVVAIGGTRSGRGYWLATTTGTVFGFGDAPHHGDLASTKAKAKGEVTDLSPAPLDSGYYVVTDLGEVHAFGSAVARPVDLPWGPVIGITPTPTNGGFWLVSLKGDVTAAGDAVLHGDLAGKTGRAGVVDLAAPPSGSGYWLGLTDGRVVNFGGVGHHGDLADRTTARVVALAPTPFVNRPPTARDDAVTTNEDQRATSNVLANDTDPDGDPLTARLVTGPRYGSVTLDPDGRFVYVPNPDVNGTDSFTYEAHDGLEERAIARVTLIVSAVDDAPVGNPDTYSVDTGSITVAGPGVLGNDHDVEGDAMTATLWSAPSHGSVTLDADGGFTYTPASGYSGSDGFTYRTHANGLHSDPVTVTIQVTALPTTGGGFTFDFVPDDEVDPDLVVPTEDSP